MSVRQDEYMRQDFQENSEANLSTPSLSTETVAQKAEEETLAQTDPLVLTVQQSVKTFNRTLWGVLLFTGISMMAVVLFARWLIENRNPYLSIPFILLTLSAVVTLFLRPRAGLMKAKEAITEVAQGEKLEALGALIELLSLEKELNVNHAMVAVTNILNRIQPEDSWALSTRHRTTLRNILNRNIEAVLYRDLSNLLGPISLQHPANLRAINMRVAIIKAFGQVGTEAEVATVERWASIEAKSEAQTILKNAAMECLPLLKARVATLSDQKTLLRASHPTEENSLLLRPSQESIEPSEQLLRPSTD